VPDDKTENPEVWAPFSYRWVVDILAEIRKLDIEQKIKVIIDDYIEFLRRRHIVENKGLDELLERISARYPVAVDLLVKYNERVSPLGRRLREICLDIFRKFDRDNGRKIICDETASGLDLRFFTKRMNDLLPPSHDEKGGSWGNGQKYNYEFKPLEKQPTIKLVLGNLDQDDDTMKIMLKINKAADNKKKFTKQWHTVKGWPVNYGDIHVSLDEIDEKSIREEILKALEELLVWEDELFNFQE
jgi:hypothetical protein